VVPGGGVEPPRPEGRRILSPLRLPVPPSRHFLEVLDYKIYILLCSFVTHDNECETVQENVEVFADLHRSLSFFPVKRFANGLRLKARSPSTPYEILPLIALAAPSLNYALAPFPGMFASRGSAVVDVWAWPATHQNRPAGVLSAKAACFRHLSSSKARPRKQDRVALRIAHNT
jgi:hypothetical protein